MANKVHKLRLAKASDQDLKDLYDYLSRMDSKSKLVPPRWRTVLWGYELMRNHLCRPESTTIEFPDDQEDYITNPTPEP